MTMTWEDAVAQLSGARTKAEISVSLLKKFGGSSGIARGRLIYTDAKAEADAIIAGLIVALSVNGQPERLSSLKERVERAVSGLARLRNIAESQLPKLESVIRDLNVGDILNVAIEHLQKPLLDAVVTLYNNYRTDNELTRETIRRQLEAARWLDFAAVKAAA
jgi:hypothetical protein